MLRKPGALAARPTDKEAEKGRVDKAFVKRYRAGTVPEFAAEAALQEQQLSHDREAMRTEVAAPVIVRKADPRLDRLRASRGDMDEAREEHRAIRAAEVVRRRHAPEQGDEGAGASDNQEGSDQEDQTHIQHPSLDIDEEEQARRRLAVRERLMQQQRAAEASKQQTQQSEDEEEETSSEYETDSGDEEYGRKLLKPVFVPKQARETIAERVAIEQEEEQAVLKEKQRLEARKLETRQLVAEVVAHEMQAAKAAVDDANKGVGNADDINTDDEGDQIAEYEAWKVRELARIKRMREAKDKHEQEQVERVRLKSMTDEERRAWEAANPKQVSMKSKSKWKYLQKYWHKGAFFQEDPDDERGTTARDDIFVRDYSAPTGEDKFNKELLPKVMQVKNFGRSGRTKWTHLLNEDTTAMAQPLAAPSADRKRYGTAEEFAKPKKFKT